MTYGLNLVAEYLTVRNPETIEFCRSTYTQVPVVHIVEARDSIYHLTLVYLIPRLINLTEQRTVSKINTRCKVQITKQRETGLNGNRMLHTVFPVFTQTGVKQLLFLGFNLVGHCTRITHRDLLIPAFVAYPLLTLERIELGYRYGHFWQREFDGRVTHILVQTHRCANIHTDT